MFHGFPTPPSRTPSELAQLARTKISTHPWYTATGLIVGSVVLIRQYFRSSRNKCDCTTDLTGKTVVITGGNAGIGKATAMELARRNATVIIGCRNSETGMKVVKEIAAATGNHNVTFKHLDLCNFSSVRNFSEGIKGTEKGLHILINNDAIRDSGKRRLITLDGCEHVMQVNYLGHFLLTLSLADLLKKSAPSRIINVASMFYKWGELDVEALNSEKKYDPTAVYNKSKMATVLFTTELSKKLENTGVTVNTVQPGMVRMDIVKNSLFYVFITRILFFLYGQTPFEAAQTTIHLALSPDLQKVSGKFFSNCKEEKLAEVAQDEALAKKLFKKSEEIVGLKI